MSSSSIHNINYAIHLAPGLLEACLCRPPPHHCSYPSPHFPEVRTLVTDASPVVANAIDRWPQLCNGSIAAIGGGYCWGLSSGTESKVCCAGNASMHRDVQRHFRWLAANIFFTDSLETPQMLRSSM